MLIVCFIIKLFGGNWFEIICNNEHFINICNYLDRHLVLQDIIAYILYIPSTALIMLASSSLPKPKIKQVVVLIGLITLGWALNYLSLLVKSLVEIVLYALMPIILYSLSAEEQGFVSILKKNWWRGLVGGAFCFGFQALSFITRNIGINFLGDNTLMALILMIDYYIMIILYYLYIRLKIEKKEIKENG